MAGANHDIHLVIFDLGRVLIRICDDWEQACAYAAVKPPEGMKDPAILARITLLGREHECGRIDTATHDRQVAEQVGLQPEQIAAVSSHWLRDPYPGVEPLFERLRQSGVQTACLSNTNQRHWDLMNGPGRCGLPLRRLDYRFASHLLGVMKPDLWVYQQVERITAQPGPRIAYFDDHAPNIEAARQRHWRAYQIDAPDPVQQMSGCLAELGVF